jgi:hypothetical protein
MKLAKEACSSERGLGKNLTSHFKSFAFKSKRLVEGIERVVCFL